MNLRLPILLHGLLAWLTAALLALAPLGAAHAAADDTDFLDSFAASMRSSAINLTMADLQSGIGDGVEAGRYVEGDLAHAALHGLVGCAAGEALGGNCASGFAAGVAQSVYAGYLKETQTTLSDLQQKERAQILGASVGYFTSGGRAANVSVSASVALSGMENNRLLHREEAIDLLQRLGLTEDELRQLLVAQNWTDEQLKLVDNLLFSEALYSQLSPEQQRIIEAACAQIRCYAQVPVLDDWNSVPEFRRNLARQGTAPELAALRDTMSSTGLYTYTRADLYSDIYLNTGRNLYAQAGREALFATLEGFADTVDGLFTLAALAMVARDESLDQRVRDAASAEIAAMGERANAALVAGMDHLANDLPVLSAEANKVIAAYLAGDPRVSFEDAQMAAELNATIETGNVMLIAGLVYGGPLTSWGRLDQVMPDTAQIVRRTQNAGGNGAPNTGFRSSDEAFDAIGDFRSRTNITDAQGGTGTVAVTDVNGQRYFGVNSTNLTDADKNLARGWRDRLGLSRGQDQVVFHAEAHSLMRAYDRTNGNLPSNMNLYVDRNSCGTCQTYLPRMAEEMGISNLNLSFTSGRTAVIRNGTFEWVD